MSDLAPYQQRVVEEQADLFEKLVKLRGFIISDLFTALDRAAQELLKRQLVAMEAYNTVLLERIGTFGTEKDTP